MVRAVVLALAGCSYVTDGFQTNGFSGDPFPIDVDTTSGALIVAADTGGDRGIAVLDALSPVTMIDPGPTVAPSIGYPDLTIYGERGPGGPLDLPRAKFLAPQVLALHPCSDATCAVGTPANPVAFDFLIGLSLFNSDALRLRLGDNEMFILPDIAGDEQHRSHACDAVLPFPFRGGGTMLVGGTEIGFTNWRLAIDACLAPMPSDAMGVDQSDRGADVLLVVSTGIGPSLLSESAYERYRAVVKTAPALTALPDDTIFLPSGLVNGKHATIQPQVQSDPMKPPWPAIALVANSSNSPRAPCRQVWASHLLIERDCMLGDDCPCGTSNNFCAVPAVVELAPAVDVLVVPDANDTLQALRTELRPDRPEVDGILGASALRTAEYDIDYVHDRIVSRCSDRTQCVARPELSSPTDRPQIQGCLGER